MVDFVIKCIPTLARDIVFQQFSLTSFSKWKWDTVVFFGDKKYKLTHNIDK